ncbi:MAG: pantetheine-phosphate adenylyltransferase [Candidatus Caldarchaeum sp.]|nr:pantetheine-phosphate adenylyltransferase [Candidatus Caldarchaeum sp.]
MKNIDIAIDRLYPAMARTVKTVDWDVLVETVRALPLYVAHKAYVREKILLNKPDVSVEEVVERLGATRGEAMVILWELRKTGQEVLEMLEKKMEDRPVSSFAAVGGTFSTIHVGHMALLATAYAKAEKVLVGVTSDLFAAKLGKNHPIPPVEKRIGMLRDFLGKMGWLDRTELAVIDDPYGPAVQDPTLDAVVTSPATAFRAAEINAKRVERNLGPLEIFVCPLVVADDGLPVSTTRIMAGEITFDGKVVRKGLERS